MKRVKELSKVKVKPQIEVYESKKRTLPPNFNPKIFDREKSQETLVQKFGHRYSEYGDAL